MSNKVFQKAFWEGPNAALVFLIQDWECESLRLPLQVDPEWVLFEVERVAPLDVARLSGYFVDGEQICFVLDPAYHAWVDTGEAIFVAGAFNGWQHAVGKDAYRLRPLENTGGRLWGVEVPVSALEGAHSSCFRFVTEGHRWLSVPEFAPNLEPNRFQGSDFVLNLKQSGRHVFRLKTCKEVSLQTYVTLRWKQGGLDERVAVSNAEFYLSLHSELPMGVSREGEDTVFRLFAPRANRVTLELSRRNKSGDPVKHALQRNRDGSWELRLKGNHERWFYYYYVDGINHDASTYFDATFPVVDPYAKAMVSPKGPGIVLTSASSSPLMDGFVPPCWHDLVIAEVHMRDLMAKARELQGDQDRQRFSGIASWLRSPDHYLRKLGVNALEFLPLHEFEYGEKDEYHWGYMPVNYFSPASCHVKSPRSAEQVEHFRDLVKACHEAGFAFILDVVYNHLGSPNPLYAIDKHYYFEVDSKFNLTNWSGVGNDLRARSPMAKQLIIDSLTHYVTEYGVDGFRFDLAELIGRDVLVEIESALKRVKPSVILIAEPWSFRGHIADKLKASGFSSWNDGYRDFFARYLRGEGNAASCFHFMKGSPGALTRFPAQTVNYSESHDDFCWLDHITENANHDGGHPTLNDIRRTHLMFSLLMASLGIPMLAQGQDFLRTKRGVHNTYQRGDLNALDYDRLVTFSTSHEYVRNWIHFRLSADGAVFRLDVHPSEEYFRQFCAEQGDQAHALCINWNYERGGKRWLYAINPTNSSQSILIDAACGMDRAIQIADHFRFDRRGLTCALMPVVEGTILMPPMSCGFWLLP
jgi:pullulanase/glycogen debranching enzyme